MPGGIDPNMPEARRINNHKEIPFDKLQLYFLTIKINKGIDLFGADKSITGSSSDPFCEVIANGQKFTTKTLMKTLNPEWNEETTFCFFDIVKQIEFKVWDYDKNTKHDSIGNCVLNTSLLFDDNNVYGFNGDIKLKNVSKGKINVSVKGAKIFPNQIEKRCQNLEIIKDLQQNMITLCQQRNEIHKHNEQLKNDTEKEKTTIEDIEKEEKGILYDTI